MDEFVQELERLRREHAERFATLPMEYSPALSVRIVEYVRSEQKQGISVAQCAARLQVPLTLLRKWLYRGGERESAPKFAQGAMRPVQILAELVRVPDGVAERRFTVRSRRGWTVRDLSHAELVELLRSLQ